MKKLFKSYSLILMAFLIAIVIPTFAGCGETEKCAIYFESNGGSAIETIYFDEPTIVNANELPVPTREGYVFRGWDTDYATGGTLVSINVYYEVHLYANWAKTNVVNLVVDNNEEPVVEYSVEDENYCPQYEYPEDGYMVKAWYEDDQFETLYYNKPLHTEKTLYAKLVPAYTINFVTNGGTEVKPQKVEINEESGAYAYVYKTSEKEGYRFDAWYEDEELTTKFTSRTLEGNITLYARFVDKNVVSLSASTFKKYFNFSSSVTYEAIRNSTTNFVTGYRYYYSVSISPKLEAYAESEHSGAQIKVNLKLLLSRYQQGNVTSSSDKTTYFDVVLDKANNYTFNKSLQTTTSGNIANTYWLDYITQVTGEIYVAE